MKPISVLMVKLVTRWPLAQVEHFLEKRVGLTTGLTHTSQMWRIQNTNPTMLPGRNKDVFDGLHVIEVETCSV